MTFLTLAFVSVWVLVTAYIIFLSHRQSSLEQEMRTLEEMIDDATHRKVG